MTANATVEEPVKILDLNLEKESNTTRTKREVVEEEEEGTEDETEEKCRVDMWRCLSKVSYQSFFRHFFKMNFWQEPKIQKKIIGESLQSFPQ